MAERGEYDTYLLEEDRDKVYTKSHVALGITVKRHIK